MDPNAALARLRELADQPISLDTCDEMQEQFNALDQWLTSGGFQPTAWAGEK